MIRTDMVETLFDAVLEEVSNFFSLSLREEIKLTRITPEALRKWTESWKPINTRVPPNGGWDWTDKTKNHNDRFSIKSLDIAIWNGNNDLCGLALCKRSKNYDNISILYIEGSPNNNHSLKGFIFSIIDAVYTEYAMATTNKVKQILIIDPVENLLNFYESYGYKVKKKFFSGKKCCKKGIPS